MGNGIRPEAKSFNTGSGIVRYWVEKSAGSQEVCLVFLPGLTADHTLFDAQMAHFSGKLGCLVWDAPAHGESRPYPLDFTMDDYVVNEQIERFIAGLSV